jgi:UDP-glucose 4-epimerase
MTAPILRANSSSSTILRLISSPSRLTRKGLRPRSDLASAHVEALRYLKQGNASLTVNLGTGRAHSVLAVLEAVERVTGRSVKVEWTDRRPGDPPTLVADGTQARALLNFAPQYSELDTITNTAWRARAARVATG